MLTCLFLCKGVPQLQLSHAHMRDGINILDMLNILAAAMLPPSPAIFHDLFFSGKTLYSMEKLGVCEFFGHVNVRLVLSVCMCTYWIE